ncbi:MAG: hypothetical protein HRT53_05190 [Colwellia sp.]|nr:hypothetical protein [Colwellia sp.]
MKLSRTGWNNVIIFSVMIFIIVINITNKKLFSSDDKQQLTIFAKHAVILSLSIEQQISVDRVGRNWQATPAKISGQALEQMMLTWHEIEGDIVTQPPELDRQMALVVSIELAGDEQTNVLNLFITNTELLVFNNQEKRWLAFPLAIFSQLIPTEILAS